MAVNRHTRTTITSCGPETGPRILLVTHPRGGPLREGPRGGFRALIRAGRRHKADERRVGGRAPTGGDHKQWDVCTATGEHVSQYRKRGFVGHKKAESTPGKPEGQQQFLFNERPYEHLGRANMPRTPDANGLKPMCS